VVTCIELDGELCVDIRPRSKSSTYERREATPAILKNLGLESEVAAGRMSCKRRIDFTRTACLDAKHQDITAGPERRMGIGIRMALGDSERQYGCERCAMAGYDG
jgi:hypothetical protein